MVLQAYIDGSGIGDSDLLVLAGFIASAERWIAFSDEWQERLDMRPALEAFKMSEMAQSPARMERASWFYNVIEDHVSAGLSVSIDVKALARVIDEIQWPSHFADVDEMKNPYLLLFKAILYGVTKYQSQIGLTEPIDFVFDNEAEQTKVLQGWPWLKKYAIPEISQYLGDTPIFRDDRTTLPLQAADLYAWWVRKWTLAKLPVNKWQFPWPAKRALPWIDLWLDEPTIRANMLEAIRADAKMTTRFGPSWQP